MLAAHLWRLNFPSPCFCGRSCPCSEFFTLPRWLFILLFVCLFLNINDTLHFGLCRPFWNYMQTFVYSCGFCVCVCEKAFIGFSGQLLETHGQTGFAAVMMVLQPAARAAWVLLTCFSAEFSQEEGALHACVAGWKSHLPGRCGHATVYSPNRRSQALNAVCSFSPQDRLHNPFLYVIISSG